MSRLAKRSRHGQESKEMLTDILGRLEEIQSSLETAESDQEACRRGIRAADEALKLTSDDPDVKSDIRMKRAQLLYIAAKKKYNTNSLVKDPISSCIAECEQVCTIPNEILNKEAQKLIIQARQLQETRTMDSNEGGESFKKFDPRKTRFTSLQTINTRLLQDVVTGYKHVKRVCRTCYYLSKRQESLVHPNRCKNCNRNEVIRLIPASKMCQNELNLNVIPVPPAPPTFMVQPNKPFEHCKKDGHPKCFELGATNEVWYSHSIEELVIWTIERFYGCSFDEYIKHYHGNKVSPIPIQEMDTTSDYAYHPNKVIFKNTASISSDLLRDVAISYEDRKEYCKWCFYHHAKVSTPIVVAGGGNICSSCRSSWESVIVIKSNDQCWNFGDFNLLPIAPWPRSKPHATPFEYCQKEDHHRCFKVYSVDEFWYAHSVEELVIWTVERDYGLAFSDCIHGYLKALLKNPSSDPSPIGHTSLVQVDHSTRARSLHQTSDESVFIPSAASLVVPSYGTFHLLSCQFSRVSDIPQVLLQEVARSYQRKMDVCRTCFYGERRVSRRKGATCDSLEAHRWTNPLMLMPPCPQCDNTPCFAFGEYITLPPPPPMAKLKPCPERNHRQCFVNCLDKQDERFAHSVESLVVWIVESENGSIEDYITGLENQSTAAGSHVTTHPRQAPSKIYFPESVSFTAKSIPRNLLADVSRCYSKRRLVCRLCYFDKGNGQTLSDQSPMVLKCVRGHAWKPLCVIPRSEMCAGPSNWVAMFPIPDHMKEVNTAFTMCNKTDGHRGCLEKARTENPWFPHTVEEIVIWTMEREQGASFGDIFTKYLNEPADDYPAEYDYYDNQSSDDHYTYDDEYPPYHVDQSDSHVQPDPASGEALDEALRKLLSAIASEGAELPAPQEEQATLEVDTSLSSGSVAAGYADNQYELFPALYKQQPIPGGMVPFVSSPSSLSQPDQLSSSRDVYSGPVGTLPSVAGPGGIGQQQQGHLALPRSEGSPGLGTTLHKDGEEEVFYSQDSQQGFQLDRFGGEGSDGRALSQEPRSDLSSAASQVLLEDSPSLYTKQGTLHADTTTGHTGDQAGSGEAAVEGWYTCLLCYQSFESAEELAEHCQDGGHVSAVMKDCCYATIWKYVPPPFDKTPSQFSMCPRSDVCKDRLDCQKAHSEDEFVEWGNRYQHRKRKTAGEQNPLNIVPQGVGVVLPANGDLEYGVKLSLSGQPQDVSVSLGKEVSWLITLEGQNWQTLFGIVCNSESKSMFNIARIEGDTFLPKQPKKPEWKPKSIEQAILLGKVFITLKAAVTTAGHHQCCVHLHLGFQHHFCLNLSVHVGPQSVQQTHLQKVQPVVQAKPPLPLAQSQTQQIQTVKQAIDQLRVQRSQHVPTNDPEQHQSPDHQSTLSPDHQTHHLSTDLHFVAFNPASSSGVVVQSTSGPSASPIQRVAAQVNIDAPSQKAQSETNTTAVVRAPENRAPENRAPENRVPENRAPENRAPENRVPENRAPENRVPENRAPENRAPENRVIPVGANESTNEVSDTARAAVPKENSLRGTTQEQTRDASITVGEQSKMHKSLAIGWAEGIGLVAEDDTLLKYTKDPFFDNLIASFIK